MREGQQVQWKDRPTGSDAYHLFDEMPDQGNQAEVTPNRVLNITVHQACYPITETVLNQVFSAYGAVESIHVFQEEWTVIAVVTYLQSHDAKQALLMLNGRNIYDSCCQLEIGFATSGAPEVGREHHILSHMTRHLDSSMGVVRHVTVNQVFYPVTKEVLHQIYDSYGAEKVHVLASADSVQALILFQSSYNARRARDFTHGRCIYDHCCVLDVQLVVAPPYDSGMAMSTTFLTSAQNQNCDMPKVAATSTIVGHSSHAIEALKIELEKPVTEVMTEEPEEQVQELCTMRLLSLDNMSKDIIDSNVYSNSEESVEHKLHTEELWHNDVNSEVLQCTKSQPALVHAALGCDLDSATPLSRLLIASVDSAAPASMKTLMECRLHSSDNDGNSVILKLETKECSRCLTPNLEENINCITTRKEFKEMPTGDALFLWKKQSWPPPMLWAEHQKHDETFMGNSRLSPWPAPQADVSMFLWGIHSLVRHDKLRPWLDPKISQHSNCKSHIKNIVVRFLYCMAPLINVMFSYSVGVSLCKLKYSQHVDKYTNSGQGAETHQCQHSLLDMFLLLVGYQTTEEGMPSLELFVTYDTVLNCSEIYAESKYCECKPWSATTGRAVQDSKFPTELGEDRLKIHTTVLWSYSGSVRDIKQLIITIRDTSRQHEIHIRSIHLAGTHMEHAVCTITRNMRFEPHARQFGKFLIIQVMIILNGQLHVIVDLKGSCWVVSFQLKSTEATACWREIQVSETCYALRDFCDVVFAIVLSRKQLHYMQSKHLWLQLVQMASNVCHRIKLIPINQWSTLLEQFHQEKSECKFEALFIFFEPGNKENAYEYQESHELCNLDEAIDRSIADVLWYGSSDLEAPWDPGGTFASAWGQADSQGGKNVIYLSIWANRLLGLEGHRVYWLVMGREEDYKKENNRNVRGIDEQMNQSAAASSSSSPVLSLPQALCYLSQIPFL